MTREERIKKLRCLITCMKCEVSGKECDDNCPTQYNAGNMGEIIENLEAISKALEQESRKDEVILTKEEYGELVSNEFDNGYAKGYREALEQEPTTKNDLGVDAVSRQAINGYIDYILSHGMGKKKSFDFIKKFVANLPSATTQEPRCKECKWWKDSDGEYRRGCRAESRCPINRREVFEGNGYCYLFEPQESEDKE